MSEMAFSVVVGIICILSVVIGLASGWVSLSKHSADIVDSICAVFAVTCVSLVLLSLLFLGFWGITGQLA